MLNTTVNPSVQALVPVTAIAITSAPANVISIYPKEAFALLKLKCPLARCFGNANADTVASMSGELRSGLNRTFANFDGGRLAALNACGKLPDFDQAAFDAEITAGTQPGAPHYTCIQARAHGSTVCPANGCTLPMGGLAAEAPIDLLTWDCNIKEVGQSAIAESVVASEYGCKLIGVRDKVYVSDQGIFAEVRDDELINKIMPHLGSKRTVRQAVDISKLLRISHVRRMDGIKPDPNFICFKNGTLNVGTKQLEPHSPAHMLLNRIDHDFDPEAKCPAFLRFLDTTFNGDADSEQKIKLLQEWFGYIMLADTRMQKMLILQGHGANGKSCVMDLAKHIVGSTNTTGAMLHRLKMPYVRAELEGKLLNQSADLPKLGSVADGDMKSIVSGDGVEVSPKHKPSHTIRPYARLMVATNHLPSSNDSSEGYFRRLMILTFNNLVPEGARDTRLVERLTAETKGIIAWAVQGLYVLLERGTFTVPSSSARVAEAYRAEVSPIKMFAEDCLEHSPDRSGYFAKDLFGAFRLWCRDRGFNAEDMVSMGRALYSMGFRNRKSGTSVWLVKAKDSADVYFNPALILLGEVTAPEAGIPPSSEAAALPSLSEPALVSTPDAARLAPAMEEGLPPSPSAHITGIGPVREGLPTLT